MRARGRGAVGRELLCRARGRGAGGVEDGGAGGAAEGVRHGGVGVSVSGEFGCESECGEKIV